MREDKKASRGVGLDTRRGEEPPEGTDKLLETLLDHTHMLVAYLDPEFNFVMVNRAYAQADGQEPSFFPGKNHFDLYPNAENQEIFSKVARTGRPYFAYARPFEYAEHPERGISYWDWSLIPIKDLAGAVEGLVLTLVNVTEREEAERALRDSEERLRRFMESATDSFTLWDKDLNLIETNESGLQLYAPGIKKADLIGRNILELVPELRQSGRYEKYRQVIKTGRPFQVDDLIIDPRFGERRVAVRTFKVGDGLGMVVTDVTERKRVEEELKKAYDELESRVRKRTRELSAANIELKEEVVERRRAEEKLKASEEKYKTLVETSRDIIFTVDLKGNFLFTNQAFEKLLGYSAEEIKGLNGFELVHPDDSKNVAQQFARLIEGESVDNMEYRYMRKDGSYISILNSAAPVFDSDGNVVAAFGVARDITRRKQAEQELRRYRDHLRELVAERTAELKRANEQLQKEIAERRQAEEGLEWELSVNRELAKLSGALITRLSSIPDIANIVLDSAKNLTQSEHGYVSSIDPKTFDHVAHTLTEMMGKQCQVRGEDRRIRFAIGADGLYPSLWGHSLNSRKAFSTNAPDKHEASRGVPEGHIPIKNFLSVPAMIGEELVGQIALANSDRAYTDRDLDAVKRLAELYAVAIQRRRAEEELTAEKEFTERALSAQTDTFFVFEPSTGRAVRWNKAFNQISGYSDEEIRSMKAPDSYYSAEDLNKAAAAAKRTLDEGIATVELSLITKDGRSIPTEYTGSAMKDEEGKPKYIIAVGRDVRERRLSEERIKRQNEFLKNIIESLTHPFCVIDAHDYTIKAANSAALSGGPPGSSTCYSLGHGRTAPCQGKEHPCPLAELKKTKKPVVVEHIHYDREGNARTVEVYGYPIFDRQGDVAQMIEYSLDVTERKQAEEALRESEEKFRGLAEQSPNMIFINRGGSVVYANRRCEEIIGCNREEFYSPDFDFLDLVAPESRDLVKENFSRHLRGEEVHPYEYTLCTREGQRIEAILNSELITYGGEAAILGIVTDITGRKRVEEELQKRTYDLGERVKELNCLYLISNLVEKPGISLEEILQGTAELIPAAWEYPEITCARVILGGKIFRTNNFKETVWKQLTDIVVQGNPVGSVEVCYLKERPEKDEGPFLADERNLLKAIAERLGRVVERTRAREEIQELNQNLKLQASNLAAANKELEAFSYSVSHDLRAPLRTIDGFSRALLEDYSERLDGQANDYLNRVRAAARRMGNLIDDLLNLSLMMRVEMRREEVNLSELAQTVAAELRKTQPERRVDFVIQPGVVAQGDARLLGETLEKLLENAWKFTGKRPRARIEFGVKEREEQRAYFVRDNGAGFKKEYADKLFVPFQRLHSKEEFPGEGIGLAIAGRIINRHEGRIWAEGEVEKGATFYFTLR